MSAKWRMQVEDDQGRADIRWGDLFPSPRVRREYTAKLVGIPSSRDQLSICREAEAKIHGRPMKPESCGDRVSERICYATALLIYQG
ncbi:hypothetical protein BDZ94DRAFT_1264684 [Collybia nuda]|uniref:Uncharacterized protein n=1 Tax=Collybia nuda TaxID=64659 RepID=A0A9P5Y0G3_9AGAR|nr:hypothetical protein BDZ94DRAFT_1264684 [Collybia nuda]